jgi:hypothetical protein
MGTRVTWICMGWVRSGGVQFESVKPGVGEVRGGINLTGQEKSSPRYAAFFREIQPFRLAGSWCGPRLTVVQSRLFPRGVPAWNCLVDAHPGGGSLLEGRPSTKFRAESQDA